MLSTETQGQPMVVGQRATNIQGNKDGLKVYFRTNVTPDVSAMIPKHRAITGKDLPVIRAARKALSGDWRDANRELEKMLRGFRPLKTREILIAFLYGRGHSAWALRGEGMPSKLTPEAT